ncbi:hypothetical protein N7E81_01805 [Reichenbachiella carrageenanivorans]|uniref:Glycosyl hydrolase family 95 catalytic domain-containing protein n=1 Tax=Reichenbachiella carrageenanivorans TaxID=2979869 RepID=A0ABY6D1N9_9BACT|nr:hypothetical protein [Reichenbachiella carrageenanivorans]UXX79839.1 hypothetical protein N7E81_01805 [Reichenbachiella carrageenanivorans]
MMNNTKYLFILFVFCSFCKEPISSVRLEVDYEAFLSQHDMRWDVIPHRWEVAPYTGNGNVGFLFYRMESEGKNTMSIYLGRHDYYDHREAPKENQMLWIYRSRLPLGHFKLESKGNITGVDLRLSLWDAQLTGVIETLEGSYQIKGYSHSDIDVISFETIASGGELVKITWHPDAPIPPVWKSLQAGGGPKSPNWDKMRNDPMPMPPPATITEENGQRFCLQMLYKNRGETTTGWEVSGEEAGTQRLLASVHHSFPAHNSKQVVKQNLQKAKALLDNGTFEAAHTQWWHEYYPLSFLTINDAEKEAFYWIQMYKFASATRGNGPIMDLMGPWYHDTFWPMVWGDLNVELQYWTYLTANRLSVGESLVNSIDKYAKNLEDNVPDRWGNSAAVAALLPQDFIAYNGGKVPDMLVWILHDYWLHCQYAGDRERMRDKLFPLLKKAVNSYLNYLEENPVDETDGKIHVKNSWSPEYPNGHGQDINFTLALMRWSCQTLLDLNDEFDLNDPLAGEWKNIMTHLVGFQLDEHGLRIGKDIAFEKRHRHYSHLLAFYPLAVLTAEEDSLLVRTTLDHWLDITVNTHARLETMPVTGYTATGAASMYAALGDADKAYYYLDFLIKHENVSTTTMYAEGNPVIESPLSFATCVHDMLLQSMGGVIKVFPGTPARWGDATFHQLRTQGAFLVSARRKNGSTQFVAVESLEGSPCVVKTDLESPNIYIDGIRVMDSDKVLIDDSGAFSVDLKIGETVVFSSTTLRDADLTIRAIPLDDHDKNLFGFSEKTARLPGHQFYKKSPKE